MNVKLALILVLLFLILLVLFYNINLESNIVILLGIIIILLVNDLIKRSEFFISQTNYDKEHEKQILQLDSILTMLTSVMKNKKKEIMTKQLEQKYKALPVSNSCIRQNTQE